MEQGPVLQAPSTRPPYPASAANRVLLGGIDNNTPPPLADSTVAQKRRKGQADRTLVATGDMRESIRVESKADSGRWVDDGE